MHVVPLAGLARKPFGATDFGEIPLGNGLQSHGWTRGGANTGGGGGVDYTTATYISTASADAGSPSGRGIVVDQTNVNEYRNCTWDLLGSSVTDFEFLALIKFIVLPDSTGGGGFCRVLGDALLADGYDWVADGDALAPGNDRVHVSQFTDGFFDNEVASLGITLDTTNLFWMRGRAAGTTYGIKCWQYGTAEPAAFISAVDPTYTTGKVGIQTVRSTNFRVDWFAVALGSGRQAPGPSG